MSRSVRYPLALKIGAVTGCILDSKLLSTERGRGIRGSR
jgi:hypothetical protein